MLSSPIQPNTVHTSSQPTALTYIGSSSRCHSGPRIPLYVRRGTAAIRDEKMQTKLTYASPVEHSVLTPSQSEKMERDQISNTPYPL